MNEFRMEDLLPVEALKAKIWPIFDVLKNENTPFEDYFVVLFLLSAYKDGFISSNLDNDSYLNDKGLILNITDDKELQKEYFPLFAHYADYIDRMSVESSIKLYRIFKSLDREVLNTRFPELFDSILFRIIQSQGRFGGEFIQPLELTRFICNLFELPPKSKVYNPFAGLASFGILLESGHEYFGQELNEKTWALGALRIKAHGRQGESRYVCDDSILHWPDPSEKFDLIVANPPYGLRLDGKSGNVQPEYRTIEQFLLHKGVNSLNANGKLIALLPQGILYRGVDEQRLRKYLVDEDLIDTIIALPGGLLFNTGIPLTILVLNKNKKSPGVVKFVDAKNFVETKSSRDRVLNDIKLLSYLNTNQPDSDLVRVVANEKIISLDYNLNVLRYFQKQIDGVKLGNILEFVRGQKSKLPDTGKLIRIRDLKDDTLDFQLDENAIENVELNRFDIYQITESCLLLAVRWKTLKPTFFKYNGEAIYRSRDILSFKVNGVIADQAYLINELHADYVKEQIESYRMGTTIPFIRLNDLMEVIIKLPPIQEQKAKVQGVSEYLNIYWNKNTNALPNLLKYNDILSNIFYENNYREFASLKHTLGQPRQNILDWTDNLLHFLQTNPVGSEALNKAFIELYDIDINSALLEIKRDINFITDVLEKGESGFVLEKYEITTIPLTDINALISQLSNNGFKYLIKKLLLKSEKLKERGINANPILFKTLLDNILTNANKYGFESKEISNEVVIELTELDDWLSVVIKNNGKPFPKNFDREKFITKYSTADSDSGSGLGGYDINRIATYFNNPEWELSLNDDPFYPVKFKFLFPIKLMN